MDKLIVQDIEGLTAPASLASTQQWFADVITHPLTHDNLIQPISPHGFMIAEEASYYILPGPTLRPHQRIQVYNQQYWWRLLNCLHDTFPFVLRLFGHQTFNEEIAVPYLVKYPPSHWSLSLLGDKLPLWVQQHYQAEDRFLVQQAVNIDWAFNASFIAPQKEPLDLMQRPIPLEMLLVTPLFLQPHLQLFHFNCDLFEFREQFLQKEADHWIENDFPPLSKERDYYFVLYRTLKNHLHWKEVDEVEYLLLHYLQGGSTIEAACEFLEQQESTVYEKATASLQKWFQDWTNRGWLTLEAKKHKLIS